MIWADKARNGPGPICQIQGILDHFLYVDVLKYHLLLYAADQRLFRKADTDPNHTSKLFKDFSPDNIVDSMVWFLHT